MKDHIVTIALVLLIAFLAILATQFKDPSLQRPVDVVIGGLLAYIQQQPKKTDQ